MNVSSNRLKHLLKGALYTLFITILIVYLFPILTQSFELKVTDLKFNLRNQFNYGPSMNSSIAIVELDDNSKKDSGLDLWPYSYYADVLNNIAAGNPNSIGSDILFTVSVDTLGWENIIDVMFDAGNIINPYKVKYGSMDKKIAVNNEKTILEYLEFEELPIVAPGLLLMYQKYCIQLVEQKKLISWMHLQALELLILILIKMACYVSFQLFLR